MARVPVFGTPYRLNRRKVPLSLITTEGFKDLMEIGWQYEGIGWYSVPEQEGVPLYRQYNPYAATGSHNYTLSKGENDALVTMGWIAEGIGWYGVRQ